MISPVDGSAWVERAPPADEEIESALQAAWQARAAWRATPVADRVEACRRMVEWCVARADVLGEELTWQMGRPIAQSPGEILRGFQERARHLCDIAPSALADLDPGPKAGFRRFIRREPLGVVLVLAPWNYPWLTSVNAVVPALLAGNPVILKMSDQTPLVAERYRDAFAAAGLPDGVFRHLHADHDQVARMIRDQRVAHVGFTGSVRGGHAVQRAASGRFIAPGLELGGKDPAYVRADAPMDLAVADLVDGAFYNSGQSCCGIERIYVDRAAFPSFVEAFAEKAKGYRLGNPLDPATDLGPMVRAAAADEVRGQIDEAIAKGARALLPRDADRPGTPYLPPQVLVDVDHGMTIMTEETFGPVVGIMAVRDDDEAVRLMNDSRYGLTASIWTTDAEAALRAGDRVETGTWFMNRCDTLDPALAWTGVKDSGRGVTLSRLGLEAMTRPKSFHLRLDAGR
jgi:acyl-CoA reductase-like NAD-dependent aldehyde dehydrogenase